MKIHVHIDTAGLAFHNRATLGRPKSAAGAQREAVEVAWVLRTLADAIERRGVVTDGPLCDSNELPCGHIVTTG